MAEPGMSTKRAIAGAVLLDLAVSPLFAWDVFTDSLRRDLGTDDTLLAGVFSVGLLTFMVGVLVGGRVADSVSPRAARPGHRGWRRGRSVGQRRGDVGGHDDGRLRRPGRRLDRAGLCHRRARRGHRAVPPRLWRSAWW